MMGIYMIKNKINNKVYIGKSVDITHRWKYGHFNKLNKNKHENEYLQRSWNKYKENNFEFSIIEECSEELLNDKEKFWISHYKSSIPQYGYNGTEGGDGGKLTKETKLKISNANKEYYSLKENKLKLSIRSKRNWENEDYRMKMSIIISNNMKIKWSNPEYRKNTSEKIKQSLNTDEQLLFFSNHAKKLWNDPEFKKNMVNKIHERANTEEFKNKCREKSLNMWKDEKCREKITKKMIEAWSDSELRERQSQRMKKYFENEENRINLSKKMKGMNAGEKHYNYGKPAYNRINFSDKQIKDICNKIKQGETSKDIGKLYNCSPKPILKIRNEYFSKDELKIIKHNAKMEKNIKDKLIDINKICNLIKNGESIRSISRTFDCGRNLINYIKNEYLKDIK